VFINGGAAAQAVRLPYPKTTGGLGHIKCIMGQTRVGATGAHQAKVKWLLGPTYLLSEPLTDLQVTLHAHEMIMMMKIIIMRT
jgi:hypothetical protein